MPNGELFTIPPSLMNAYDQLRDKHLRACKELERATEAMRKARDRMINSQPYIDYYAALKNAEQIGAQELELRKQLSMMVNERATNG